MSLLLSTLLTLDPALAESWHPLSVGSTWTYRVDGQDDPCVVKVSKKEKVGVQECAVLEMMLGTESMGTEHVAFLEEGLYRFRAEGMDVIPPVCILKLPARADAGWKVDYRLGKHAGSAEFTSGLGPVKVPMGEYATAIVASKIRTEDEVLTIRTWYAPKLGPVKRSFETDKRKIVMELTAFQDGAVKK